jgi:hypothetical protein
VVILAMLFGRLAMRLRRILVLLGSLGVRLLRHCKNPWLAGGRYRRMHKRRQ